MWLAMLFCAGVCCMHGGASVERCCVSFLSYSLHFLFNWQLWVSYIIWCCMDNKPLSSSKKVGMMFARMKYLCCVMVYYHRSGYLPFRVKKFFLCAQHSRQQSNLKCMLKLNRSSRQQKSLWIQQ